MKRRPEKSPEYKPVNWQNFDKDGKPVEVIIYASRSFTEYRLPSGKVEIEVHSK